MFNKDNGSDGFTTTFSNGVKAYVEFLDGMPTASIHAELNGKNVTPDVLGYTKMSFKYVNNCDVSEVINFMNRCEMYKEM